MFIIKKLIMRIADINGFRILYKREKMNKSVYVALVADFIHPGHLNIIEKARSLGDITVGVYTDTAIATFSRLPIMNYKNRAVIAENLKGVVKVIPQKQMSYRENLLALKPDYVVHGDDWMMGAESCYRPIQKAFPVQL